MIKICPITTFPIEQLAIAVPCGHQFEDAAIREWAARKPTCPIDRGPILGINTVDRPVVQEEVVEEVPFYLPHDPARRFQQLVVLTYRVQGAEHPELFRDAQQVKALCYSLLRKISGDNRVALSNDELFKLKQKMIDYSTNHDSDYRATNDKGRMWVIKRHLKTEADMIPGVKRT